MPPKLTKREMERERAAAAAASVADTSSLDGAAALLPQLGAVDVVSYDELAVRFTFCMLWVSVVRLCLAVSAQRSGLVEEGRGVLTGDAKKHIPHTRP